MKKFIYSTGIVLLSLFSIAGATPGSWSAQNLFSNLSRSYSVTFVINGKGYFGTGAFASGSNNIFLKDFWEYDPTSDTWTQKADYAGNERTGASGFSTANFGYVGLGADQLTTYKDFWQFDPNGNVWTAKAVFPGTQRVYAISYTAGGSGYIGLGRAYTPFGNTLFFNDVYQYDESNDAWIQKGNYPGLARSWANTVELNGKGYIIAGSSGGGILDEVWEYTPGTDGWIQKSSLPGARTYATGFAMHDSAFVGLGRQQNGNVFTFFNDMWAYDPIADTWSAMTSFPGAPRYRAIAFGLIDHGYIALGSDAFTEFNDVWKFDPLVPTITGISNAASQNIKIYPTVTTGQVKVEGLSSNDVWTIHLFTSTGQSVYRTRIQNSEIFSLDLSNFTSGIYILKMESAGKIISEKLVKE
ncbi:hypothetical protein BH11BAC2_BH11BAC2_25620 [soil metagenome]